METVLTPRQKRSQQTQERLLEALETLLRQRYFEQITIQDIAAAAGVAVGTIYRRFRNKEALLPVLYRRLDERMARWAARVWTKADAARTSGLRPALHHLVAAHLRFYKQNAPTLRTLYLHVRLDPELADPARARMRKDLYMVLLEPVWTLQQAEGGPRLTEDRVRCFVLLLLSSINERCLFPDNTPATSLRMPDRRFGHELTDALYHYLMA